MTTTIKAAAAAINHHGHGIMDRHKTTTNHIIIKNKNHENKLKIIVSKKSLKTTHKKWKVKSSSLHTRYTLHTLHTENDKKN